MGEMRVRVRAFDSAVPIVTAMAAGTPGRDGGRTSIVDGSGFVLADAGHAGDNVIWTDIDPGTPLLIWPIRKTRQA